MARPQDRAVRAAAVMGALYAGHELGDHWVQTDGQATDKGQPGWRGRLACAAHVATYTVTTTVTVVAASKALGLRLPWQAVAAGQAVSAISHYVADRRTPLRRLAEATGSGPFYAMGAGQGHLGTGAYALDQSWHVAWLGVAAVTTAVVADRIERGR